MTDLTVSQKLPSSSLTRPYSQWFEPAPALGISLIDHLFNRLDGAYPDKWRRNFASQQAIDNWAESWVEAFEEEGITPNDVKAGLRECRRRFAWPPSCAEFIQACKPSVDPLVAYYEAVAGVQARAAGEMGKWSHPAIYWAAVPLTFDLGAQTYSQIKTRWERALAAQMDRGEWAAIPQPVAALPAPGKGALSREKAGEMVKQLGASGVIKTNDPKFDHLRWARRLQEREKRGEKLDIVQSKFASEALERGEG
jgi:hypothetical protein